MTAADWTVALFAASVSAVTVLAAVAAWHHHGKGDHR